MKIPLFAYYFFPAFILFTPLIFGLFLTFQAPVTVIWIHHKTSINYPDSLAYDEDIASSLQQDNKEFPEPKDNALLATSYHYLHRVSIQNPHAEESIPAFHGNQLSFDIGENVTILTDMQTYYNESIPFNASVRSTFSSPECSGSYDLFSANISSLGFRLERLYSALIDCLISSFPSSGRIVTVGNDHANSYYLISSAHLLDPNSKIGLFVFDEHIDLYGLMDKDNILAKSNVFGKLLLEGKTEYISFIGTSDLTKDELLLNTDQTFTQKWIFDRLSVYSDVDIQHASAQQIIGREIKEMKKRGVTNIIISIDLDVLPEEYTGFEYSILAPAIADIRFSKNISRFPTLAEVPEGFSKGLTTEELENYIFHIKRASNNNFMSYGVHKKNLHILGDIEELLPQQDLGNSTSAAAARLVRAMSS